VRTIDLNCDMGEGMASDAAMLDIVTSANIACGGHFGDEASMRAAVRGAKARGVAVGAHPGYPDRAGFGRVAMEMDAHEIESMVREQVVMLDAIAREEGAKLVHVKPHGALYHAAMMEQRIAEAVARGVRGVEPGLFLVGLAGARGLEWWRAMGMRAAAEAFADRRYERDGSLRARSKPGAMIEDPASAAEQAVRIAEGQGVVAEDGTIVGVEAGTICVHGDTAGAVEIARAVREALARRGMRVGAKA